MRGLEEARRFLEVEAKVGHYAEATDIPLLHVREWHAAREALDEVVWQRTDIPEERGSYYRRLRLAAEWLLAQDTATRWPPKTLLSRLTVEG